jgi:hypothetical protein
VVLQNMHRTLPKPFVILCASSGGAAGRGEWFARAEKEVQETKGSPGRPRGDRLEPTPATELSLNGGIHSNGVGDRLV